jgi:hypothetical protein
MIVENGIKINSVYLTNLGETKNIIQQSRNIQFICFFDCSESIQEMFHLLSFLDLSIYEIIFRKLKFDFKLIQKIQFSSLTFDSCNIDDYDASILVNYLPHIKSLKLPNNHISSIGASTILQTVKQLLSVDFQSFY